MVVTLHGREPRSVTGDLRNLLRMPDCLGIEVVPYKILGGLN